MKVSPTFKKLSLGLIPVMVGAVLGVVPVLVSTELQARRATQQRIVDRRLDAIRDYSSACHRVGLVGRRLLYVYEMVQGTILDKEFAGVEQVGKFAMDQLQTLIVETEAASQAFHAQINYTNAIFGTDLKTAPPPEMPPIGPLTEEQKKKVSELFSNASKDLPAFFDRCSADTKMLMSRLD